jgi:hypothetical protein
MTRQVMPSDNLPMRAEFPGHNAFAEALSCHDFLLGSKLQSAFSDRQQPEVRSRDRELRSSLRLLLLEWSRRQNGRVNKELTNIRDWHSRRAWAEMLLP